MPVPSFRRASRYATSQPWVRGRWSSPMKPTANGAGSKSLTIACAALFSVQTIEPAPLLTWQTLACTHMSSLTTVEYSSRVGSSSSTAKTSSMVSAAAVALNAWTKARAASGRPREGTMTTRSATGSLLRRRSALRGQVGDLRLQLPDPGRLRCGVADAGQWRGGEQVRPFLHQRMPRVQRRVGAQQHLRTVAVAHPTVDRRVHDAHTAAPVCVGASRPRCRKYDSMVSSRSLTWPSCTAVLTKTGM